MKFICPSKSGQPIHIEDEVEVDGRKGVVISLPELGKAQVAFTESLTGLPEVVDSNILTVTASLIEDILNLKSEEDCIALLKVAEEQLAAKLAGKKKEKRAKKGSKVAPELFKEDVEV